MYVSRFHLISLTIWLLTSLRLSTGDQCNPSWPQGCDCVFSGGKIDIICTTYQGSTIPPGINSSVTTLRISGAPNLTNINNMDFKQATNMTQLVIENTALATIGPGSFDSMSSLTAVYLNDNQIEAIPDNLFVHTNQLQNLELQGNSIATLSNSTFTGLTSLKLLKLQKNQLTNDINSFPDGAFAKLSKLEVLDLSQNSLSAITKAIFNGLNSLVSLSLNNNTISNIELGAFNFTTNLDQLTLAQNQLTSLPDSLFRGNGALTTLDISWNSFQGVPSNALQSAPSLEKLYLDGSLFTSIKGNAFQGLMNLKELSLSINQKLTKFEENALNGLQMLEILNVTGNPALTSFDPKVFPSRPNLKTLVLSNNSITSFQEILFSESPSLEKADISNNPLYCDCHIKWIREDMKSPEVYPWIAPWNATAICGGPQSLIGIAISQLPVEQLTCDKAKILFSETYRGPSDQPVLSAFLDGGVPWTRWQIPDGTWIAPMAPNPTGSYGSDITVIEKRFPNFTVLAQLTILIHTKALSGKYTLEAQNAGGKINQIFTVDQPDNQGGLSGGAIAGIVIGTLFCMVIAFLGFFIWKRRFAIQYREMKDTATSGGESTQQSTAQSTTESGGMARGQRSYGGVDSMASTTGSTNQPEARPDGREIFA